MNIKRDSFSYQLASFCSVHFQQRADNGRVTLCDYVMCMARGAFAAFMIVLVFSFLGSYLVIAPLSMILASLVHGSFAWIFNAAPAPGGWHSFGYTGMIISVGVIVVVSGAFGLGALSKVWGRRNSGVRHNPKEPTLLEEWYRSVKNKFCPIINIVD